MAVKNQLAKSQQKQTFSMFVSGDAMRARINQMVGSKDGPRFITSIISAVSVNPALAECDYASIVSCAMLGESLKLSPSPQLGQYYMVPYNDKKRGLKVAQFQLGYKGYIQLAIRSGYYKMINVLAIKEGELKHFDPLNEVIDCVIIEDDEAREKAATVGYYAVFEYQNGFRKAMYWSKAKMEAHADKYSKAFSLSAFRKLLKGEIPDADMWKYSSYWYSDFDGMAYKTMLRQLISKWGIMSIEMQQAYESDTAVMAENGEIQFVEEVQETTGEVVAEVTPEDASIPVPAGESAADSFFDQ